MNSDGFFRRMLKALGNPGPTPQNPPPAADQIVPAVIVDYDDSRIPESGKAKARRILACLKDVEELIAREPVATFSKVQVEQMRSQHLPKLLKSYIDIPAAHRAEIFRKMGKSASFILEDSLDQMQSKVDDIMRNLAQNDIDAFTDNARFIKQRYTDKNPFD